MTTAIARTITTAMKTTGATITTIAITTTGGEMTTTEVTISAEGTTIAAATTTAVTIITVVTRITIGKMTIVGRIIATANNRGTTKGTTDRKMYARSDGVLPTRAPARSEPPGPQEQHEQQLVPVTPTNTEIGESSMNTVLIAKSPDITHHNAHTRTKANNRPSTLSRPMSSK